MQLMFPFPVSAHSPAICNAAKFGGLAGVNLLR